jgi:hypothetical protein
MPKLAEDARLTRVTKLCAALPNTERFVFGKHAKCVVGKKTFAYYLDDHHGDGIVALNCKFEPSGNVALIASDPVRFYMPAYVGKNGWIGLRLDLGQIDWNEVDALLRTSYRLVAPKRLAATFA